MSTQFDDRLTEVFREIRGWPVPVRVSLAARILQSVEGDRSGPGRASPADLIGVWKTGQPPGDEEIGRIIE